MNKEEFVQKLIDHTDMLYYVSYGLLSNPHDQEDAVQECLRKALQKWNTLREDRYFKTWLTRILINECHNLRKRKQREFPAETIPAVQPPTAEKDVFEAISALPEKYRLVLVLHYYQGYTTQEIAKTLMVPQSTIKARLVKARSLLAELLDEKES